jgi:hypothetical protein
MTTDVVVDTPPGAAATAPLVVLLHGTNGDINDMADPAVHPGMNFERVAELTIRNRGWHEYPNVGFWSIGLDPTVPVEGWAPFLLARGFPVLNYSQIDPRGQLPRTAAEMAGVLRAVEDQRIGAANIHALEPVKDRSIVLVGHSRGGVLARQVLVDLRATGAPVLSRITRCVTLHAPNQGSTLANTAIAISGAISAWRATISGIPGIPVGTVLQALDSVLALIQNEVNAPAYNDYAVGSPTLSALAAAEPVPGITYFTFGGTRSVILNLRGWAFTPDSAVPQFNIPPFFWRTVYTTLFPLPPPLPFPEVTPGVGDVLTAAPLTRLPFSVHRDNALNHAEALWDQALKVQVASILSGSPLPTLLIVDCVTPDAADPDRAIDALGGTSPGGARWKLGLDDALALADTGAMFFVRRPNGALVPLQRVRRRGGRRYFRAMPGAGGPRLRDLPACP